jgi:hypothetical protein
VVRDLGCHRWRDPQRSVDPAKVVVREMECQGRFQILPFLRERISQPREWLAPKCENWSRKVAWREHESHFEHRRLRAGRLWRHLVPARHRRAAGQLHDRANPVGGLGRHRGGSGYLDIGGAAERLGAGRMTSDRSTRHFLNFSWRSAPETS